MRHTIITVLTLLALTLSYGQNNFEGKIKYKITSDEANTIMDYFIKDGKIRMEMGEGDEKGIFIYTGKNSLVLMPQEKMYMDLDNSIYSKMGDFMGSNDDDDEKYEKIDFEKYKTGKKKTILGYDCEQWIFTDEEEDEQVEMWITDELGQFLFLESPMGGGFSPAWSGAVNNKAFFPISVITRDEDGEETSRFEAVEIKKESLNSSLFQAPSDYEEMKIPGMDNLFK